MMQGRLGLLLRGQLCWMTLSTALTLGRKGHLLAMGLRLGLRRGLQLGLSVLRLLQDHPGTLRLLRRPRGGSVACGRRGGGHA